MGVEKHSSHLQYWSTFHNFSLIENASTTQASINDNEISKHTQASVTQPKTNSSEVGTLEPKIKLTPSTNSRVEFESFTTKKLLISDISTVNSNEETDISESSKNLMTTAKPYTKSDHASVLTTTVNERNGISTATESRIPYSIYPQENAKDGDISSQPSSTEVEMSSTNFSNQTIPFSTTNIKSTPAHTLSTKPTKETTNDYTSVALSKLTSNESGIDAQTSTQSLNEDEKLIFACNFETNSSKKTLCNMVQSRDDSFDWSLNAGRTKSSDTGPEQADSLPFYLYIEATDRKENEFAL